MAYYLKQKLPDELCECIDGFIGLCSTSLIRLDVLKTVLTKKFKSFEMSKFRLDSPENQIMEKVNVIDVIKDGYYCICLELQIEHDGKVSLKNFPYNNNTLLVITRRILNECGLDGTISFYKDSTVKSKVCHIRIEDIRSFYVLQKRMKYNIYNYIYTPINKECVDKNRNKIFKITI